MDFIEKITGHGKAQGKENSGMISSDTDLIFHMQVKQQAYTACCGKASLSCALAAESLGLGLC